MGDGGDGQLEREQVGRKGEGDSVSEENAGESSTDPEQRDGDGCHRVVSTGRGKDGGVVVVDIHSLGIPEGVHEGRREHRLDHGGPRISTVTTTPATSPCLPAVAKGNAGVKEPSTTAGVRVFEREDGCGTRGATPLSEGRDGCETRHLCPLGIRRTSSNVNLPERSRECRPEVNGVPTEAEAEAWCGLEQIAPEQIAPPASSQDGSQSTIVLLKRIGSDASATEATSRLSSSAGSDASAVSRSASSTGMARSGEPVPGIDFAPLSVRGKSDERSQASGKTGSCRAHGVPCHISGADKDAPLVSARRCVEQFLCPRRRGTPVCLPLHQRARALEQKIPYPKSRTEDSGMCVTAISRPPRCGEILTSTPLYR